MSFRKVIEGRTELWVPSTDHETGPASKQKIFFNPAMRGNRDVSVLFARHFGRDGMDVLDGLAATGIRGLRLHGEVDAALEIHINERQKSAFDLVEKNISEWGRAEGGGHSDHGYHGGRGRVEATRFDLSQLLYKRRYDWVDIDPFGSPLPYLDAAARAVKNNGWLSITATDTAPLCGTYSKACIRRYGARPLRTAIKHEVGLRILAGNVVKRFAAYEVAAVPVLCYYDAHYFRGYFHIKKGATAADNLLGQMGYVIREKSGEYRTSHWPEKGKPHGGPLWLGTLHDPKVAEGLLDKSDTTISKDATSLLKRLADEIPAPAYHYNADEMASKLETPPMATARIVSRLREAGFAASPVHYDTKGFRTNAPWPEVVSRLV